MDQLEDLQVEKLEELFRIMKYQVKMIKTLTMTATMTNLVREEFLIRVMELWKELMTLKQDEFC